MGVPVSCCCCSLGDRHDGKQSASVELLTEPGEKSIHLHNFVTDQLGAGFDEPEHHVDSDIEDGVLTRPDLSPIERQERRSQTFNFVNEVQEDDFNQPMECNSSRKPVDELIARSSHASVEAMPELVENLRKEFLQEIAKLMDHSYDFLPAEKLMAQLQRLLGRPKFMQEVVSTDLFERFCRKSDYFCDVCVSNCSPAEEWVEVYSNGDGKETIHGQIDPEDPRVLHYKVCVDFPVSLTRVMSVAHELQLLPEWNQLVVGTPEFIGRRTAHYVVLNYQVSALAGLYKADVLSEIRRFTDQEGGLLVEYIASVPKDHPCYKEPPKGYRRMQTILKNMVIACGSDRCVMVQRGKLKLPFTLVPWQVKTLGQIAGKFALGGLMKSAVRADAPGNPWAALVAEDRYGIYSRLRQCTESEESQKRGRERTTSKLDVAELRDQFSRRRFHRESQRHQEKT